jgi:asparagine synthase (glutamine-hydrolysing)
MDKTAVSRFLTSIAEEDRLTRYRSIFSLIPKAHVDGLFRSGVLDPDVHTELVDCWSDLKPLMEGTDELGGLQFLELRSSLPDELLLYADKLSMASGLEVRVPYLDHEIVEYAERLSASFKVRNGSRKWLHRRVCRRLLPAEIVQRKKLGFETPSGSWFRDAETGLAGCLNDRGSRIYEFLDYAAVHKIHTAHRSRAQNYSDTLFSLAALELWLHSL